MSIIIPCFNYANYVGEAIESALAQTYSNTEIIVIDDGSTDGSLAVIKSFGDRVRWETGPNRGACAARNRGINLAQGEYIQFLDADDALKAKKIELCLKAFTDDFHAVFSGYEWFGQEEGAGPRISRVLKIIRCLFQKNRDSRWDPVNQLEFHIRDGLYTPQPLHRAALIRQIGGYREDLRNHQEYEFHCRLALAGAKFKEIKQKLIRRRRHGMNNRISYGSDYGTNYLKSVLAVHTEVQHASIIDDNIMRAMACRLVEAGRMAYREGYQKEAKEAYKIARSVMNFPRSHSGVLYDFLSLINFGFSESLYMRLSGVPGPSKNIGKRP